MVNFAICLDTNVKIQTSNINRAQMAPDPYPKVQIVLPFIVKWKVEEKIQIENR